MKKVLIIMASIFMALSIGWGIKLGGFYAPGSYWSDYDTIDRLFVFGYVLDVTIPFWVWLYQKIFKK